MKITNLVIVVLLAVWQAYGIHIPGDSSKGGATLVRQKRDNFIDRILKSIPFLHYPSPSNILNEEQVDPLDDDDDDDNDDNVDTTIPSVPFSSLMSTPTGVSTLPSLTTLSGSKGSDEETVLSSVIPHTPTISSAAYPSKVVSMSSDTMRKQSTTLAVNVTLVNATPTASFASTLKLIPTQKPESISLGKNYTINSISATNSITNTTSAASTSYIYPSSSFFRTMSSSADIKPTVIHTMDRTLLPMNTDSPINMMIVSGENPIKTKMYGPRVANERGYGDDIGNYQVENEDVDMKNIQYMYSGVLVPIMSGILGALLITFVILIYKCIRRKKLRRVRYYGGKAGSGLYRLDQMSLLSDMSSDEE